MTTIHVTASRDYDVLVQPGLLDDAGAQTARVLGTGRTAAIVAGETVAGLYAGRLAASLTRAGFRAVTFTYPGGEHCKTLATYAALLDFLAAHRLSRSDLIVALGGGVTGDLAGFAAATYQRGIPFVQVPTTLLAAVDSSVGGKTAVNLASGKKSGRLLLSAEPRALRPGHAAHPPAGGIPQRLRRGHQIRRAAQRAVF